MSFGMPVGNGDTLSMISYILIAVGAYLFGSISFGIIYSKLVLGDDIRNHGSGNTGMTNALRSYGKSAGAIIFIGDFLKGYLGALIISVIFGEPFAAATACVGIVIGHMYPLYFHFKGGKAVATIAGIILYLDPIMLPIVLIPFFIVVSITKYISVGSILMTVVYPTFTAIKMVGTRPTLDNYAVAFIVMSIILSVLVFTKHIPNLKRLIRGTESKLAAKKRDKR